MHIKKWLSYVKVLVAFLPMQHFASVVWGTSTSVLGHFGPRTEVHIHFGL